MTSSIKLECIPELSCCTHYSVLDPVQHCIMTLLVMSLHMQYLHSQLGRVGATHTTQHNICSVMSFSIYLTIHELVISASLCKVEILLH